MRSREILNTMLPSFVVAKMLSAAHRDSRQVSLSRLLLSRTTPVFKDCRETTVFLTIHRLHPGRGCVCVSGR